MTLAQVNTAIEAILTGGQSYTVDGISYSAANLNTLHAMREKLMAETGRTNRPVFRGVNFSEMGYSK
jgi:hypothetical protein